jgi:hypothetical protein
MGLLTTISKHFKGKKSKIFDKMSRRKDTGEHLCRILGGNQMPHFSGSPLSRRLSLSLTVALCGVMLSLLSTSPLQALPTDEGATEASVPQQILGGGAATPSYLREEASRPRLDYDQRVRDAMASPVSGMRYASGRELASFLRSTKAEIEEIEFLARKFPTGTFDTPLSGIFEDLVGFVCQQMLPLLIQSAQENTQAFLQGNGTEVWSTVKSPIMPCGLSCLQRGRQPF